MIEIQKHHVVHCRKRRQPVTGIVLHTIHGLWPQEVIASWPARGPAVYTGVMDAGRRVGRPVSWHYTVDHDGAVYEHVPPELQAWHAREANGWSIGIEIAQQRPADPTPGAVTEVVLDSAVKLCSQLCVERSILMTVPDAYRGRPRWSPRKPFHGIIGHRDLTRAKGQGDPGDHVFARLVAAGAAVRAL